MKNRYKLVCLLLAFIIIFSGSTIQAEKTPDIDFSASHDSLINVVQWTSANGGNDHWYGVLAIVQPWTYHEAEVPTITYDAQQGYMVSITSHSENQFIIDNILANVTGGGIADEFFLGGTTTSGWLNGEQMTYTNFDANEPSGDGIALAMWGAAYPTKTGRWNDVPHDGPVGSINQLYAIVEFGEPDSVIVQDSLINMVQWTEASGGNDHWYGVFAVKQPWTFHEIDVLALTYNSEPGYMATITTFAENQFIVDNILANVSGAGVDEFFLGGSTTGGWLTGEEFDYTNWDSHEPSGDGIAIAMWGASYPSQVGRWNDVPHDGPVGSINQLYAIVEFGPPDSVNYQDHLINMVQWPVANGGNDHWYGVYARLQPWTHQQADIAFLTHNGFSGYMATINSPSENQFIMDNILANITGEGVDEFFLGGTTVDGWLTGEQMNYTNWYTGEPSGDGIAMAIWGESFTTRYGKWNDAPHDGPVGSIHQLFTIVEFGDLAVPTYDSLILSSVVALPGSNSFTVSCNLGQPIQGVTIPLEIPDGIDVQSLSSSGMYVDSWDYKIMQNKSDSGFIFVSFANSFGDVIPVGITDLFTVTFSGSSNSCTENIVVHFDTTLSTDVSRRLTFVDTNSFPVYPSFDKNRNSITLPVMMTGDFDLSGTLDIADLVALVDYMFLGGPPPVHINAIDMNGDCQGPDISDLVRFINYMFQNGPPLPCGCIEAPMQ